MYQGSGLQTLYDREYVFFLTLGNTNPFHESLGFWGYWHAEADADSPPKN